MPLNENQKKKSRASYQAMAEIFSGQNNKWYFFYYYSSCEENNDFYPVNCHCTGVTKVRPLNNNEMSFKKMNVFWTNILLIIKTSSIAIQFSTVP